MRNFFTSEQFIYSSTITAVLSLLGIGQAESTSILHRVAEECVCVFSSHSLWTSSSLDVPAEVTQEEGHTGFLVHLISTVRAFIFLARRIQPFLSLVDREVEFCVLTIQSLSTRWAFLFLVFSFLVRKIPFAGIELRSQRVRRLHGRDRTQVPTCQKVTWLPLSYRGATVHYLFCCTKQYIVTVY